MTAPATHEQVNIPVQAEDTGAWRVEVNQQSQEAERRSIGHSALIDMGNGMIGTPEEVHRAMAQERPEIGSR